MKTKLNLNFINFLLMALITIILLVNVVNIGGINKMTRTPVPATGTTAVVLSVTAVQPANCAKCADVNAMIDALKQSTTVNVSKTVVFKEDSTEGKALIAKYALKRLPAIILEGDVDKLPASDQVEKVGNALLVRNLPPPYYDLENKTVVGIVDVTYLTAPTCSKCADITLISQQLQQAGVALGKEDSMAYDSDSGKALVKKYNITAVPTAIFSPAAAGYPIFIQAWTTAGTVDADGSYILRSLSPPYYDLSTQSVRGLVDAIYLTDKSCGTCYNVTLHKTIFQQNFGIDFQKETTYDVSDTTGADLVKKYNITDVPTVILTGDAAAYKQLEQAWSQVGTTEKDGAMVFRQIGLLQGITYKDLSTGKVVTAASATPPTATQ